MIYLESVRLAASKLPQDAFPFHLPVVQTLDKLTFSTPVTFFVGENGSGKSTLLEAIGIASARASVGSAPLAEDATLAKQRRLAELLRLSWRQKTFKGFFMRAEDFFGFTQSLRRLREGLLTELKEVEAGFQERSEYARSLARGPLVGSLAELEARYGVDLDAHSHGESFFTLFQSRFVPGGLYLLDEPETPLSPQRQLALMQMLLDMVEADAQFIICTHSPILMALPGATIYTFDEAPPRLVAYDEVEQVRLTTDFLNDRERFLRHMAKSDSFRGPGGVK